MFSFVVADEGVFDSRGDRLGVTATSRLLDAPDGVGLEADAEGAVHWPEDASDVALVARGDDHAPADDRDRPLDALARPATLPSACSE